MSNHLVETSVVDEATRTNTERWRATTWSAMLDLAAWVQERRDEIRSGECALQLSPTVIEVMGKYFRNELEPPQPKRLSLFRKKTAGMNPSDVITTLMEATQRVTCHCGRRAVVGVRHNDGVARPRFRGLHVHHHFGAAGTVCAGDHWGVAAV
eukprot:PhM_4_TR1267/c0_g1_i2/m.31691